MAVFTFGFAVLKMQKKNYVYQGKTFIADRIDRVEVKTMEDSLRLLLEYALHKHASDIHFLIAQNRLLIQLRVDSGMQEVFQDIWKPALFEYLKFKSGMDLTCPQTPQSGQFVFMLHTRKLACRFAILNNHGQQSGVLRLLNTRPDLKISQLSRQKSITDFLFSLTHRRQGLIVSSGPTNSGKTTTLHAIVHEIAAQQVYKVVSLEDPIEIEDPSYLQLEINEEQGFTYDKGIEELLRHDPDIILIGETRNAATARMVVRAALTGHLCLTTIHAKNGLETIQRFLDFGIEPCDLLNTLSIVMAQRLYSTDTGKECVYEILQPSQIRYILSHYQYPKGHASLADEIQKAFDQGYITDPQAKFDLEDLKE